ncbi:MAG: saccharopine dehydrogenase [Calditrichales bacterium]|nr:MAG: saccharopine dehydrogenase [Calditrichales bacterium]
MQHVLVLGAGLVSKPLVVYLLRKGFQVKVASRTVSKAQALIKGYENGIAESLNVNNREQLHDLIKACDLVISLVPYTYHVQIAKLCIELKKQMVTTSYVSKEMEALDPAAKEAGILILNEIGLDPGIDHMSAMKIIHSVADNGGKVLSFKSYCGGLPALQSNNAPFGYKFSWSPRGVVMAGRNNGQYLEDDRVKFIPGRDLFKHYEILDIAGVGSFEAYTNRNAIPYKTLYGLNDAHTVFRGTLRNVGWCYTMKKAQELGLFDDAERLDLQGLTYRQMMSRLIDRTDTGDVCNQTATYLKIEPHCTVIKKFKWLGLFNDDPLPEENNVMDMFSALLQKKLVMAPGDLDLIVLYHRFIAVYGDKNKLITSTLVDTGISGRDSAMSRTVSLPAAIAADLILNKKITMTGVHIPVQPDIYNPVLDALTGMDIVFKETVHPID